MRIYVAGVIALLSLTLAGCPQKQEKAQEAAPAPTAAPAEAPATEMAPAAAPATTEPAAGETAPQQ